MKFGIRYRRKIVCDLSHSIDFHIRLAFLHRISMVSVDEHNHGYRTKTKKQTASPCRSNSLPLQNTYIQWYSLSLYGVPTYYLTAIQCPASRPRLVSSPSLCIECLYGSERGGGSYARCMGAGAGVESSRVMGGRRVITAGLSCSLREA